ncbi:solute carrier family 51 subunit beta [Corythoichthys intestinalis]|uniref:solute carrier family 51 subunit beta n=1 Tax=Corythoichthys intestinalis TaxID=161448 RepID=UPI0025A5A91C|nr:solute carrier family 51 subunit beta [Corythoichthys intestinalis]
MQLKQHHNMFSGCVLLLLFLSGGGAFLLRPLSRNMCLEERWPSGGVVLSVCRPSSVAQRWTWKGHGMLASVLTSRCLSPHRPGVTLPCQEGAMLEWTCRGNTLLARAARWRLTAVWNDWRDEEEFSRCQRRYRRASPDDEDTFVEEGEESKAAMTEEQKEYLRWFYRTEDPTVWKFVLLGLAFVCLLVGFLLLGMGAMASKNRRKIAKYKAAALVAGKCEERPGVAADACNGDTGDLKAGSIVVTWKDGNTSCLYADAPAEVGEGAEPPVPQDEDEKDGGDSRM